MVACRSSRDFEDTRSEEHTSELQSRENLVCRLLLEKKKIKYLTGMHKIDTTDINTTYYVIDNTYSRLLTLHCFSCHATASTAIYTLSYTTLFRSCDALAGAR